MASVFEPLLVELARQSITAQTAFLVGFLSLSDDEAASILYDLAATYGPPPPA